MEVRIFFASADGPAVVLGISLHPPAIQDAQVDAAVGADFHAAGAGRFQGPARIVQPNVNPLHHVTGQVDLIVFQENDAAAKLRSASDVHDLGDQLLAAVVTGMGLAGKQQLHGSILIVDDGAKPIEIAKNQRATLISGETPGETDGQCLWIEHFLGASDFRQGGAAAFELGLEPPPGEGDQPFAPPFVRSPQLGVGNVIDAPPNAVIGGPLLPLNAQIAIIELGHFRRQPTAGVNAVGDGSDGNLGVGKIRPKVLPHLAGNAAVQPADAIGNVRQPDRQHRHAKLFVRVPGILPTHSQKFVPVDSQKRQVAGEIVLDELGRKDVVARRHRGVRREAGSGGNGFAGGGEIQVLLLHQNADALQSAKSGMALVHVADRRRFAQGPQSANAADAQHHLLANARVVVPPVELRGDVTIVRGVLGDVGVQQIKRNSADLDAPDARPDFPAGERNADQKRRTVRLGLGNERQVEEIILGITLLLPAIDVQILSKISFPVHQTDAG